MRRDRTEVPFGFIVCRHAVDIACRVCTDANDWFEFERQAAFCYPDGSLQFEYVLTAEEGPLDWFSFKYRLFAGHLQGAFYRSLAPFGEREFNFNLPGDEYDRLIGSDGFGVTPPVLTPPLPSERELAMIWVVVEFHRKPRRAAVLALPAALERWATEAADGLRGEGPPRAHPGTLTFGGKLAKFAVDLSGSGQTTVNWLVLSLFAFGLEHAPLTGIRVAPSDDWLRHAAFSS